MPGAPLFIYRIQPVRPAMLTDGPTLDEERIVGDCPVCRSYGKVSCTSCDGVGELSEDDPQGETGNP